MKHETLVSDDLWEAIEPFLSKELLPAGGLATGVATAPSAEPPMA